MSPISDEATIANVSSDGRTKILNDRCMMLLLSCFAAQIQAPGLNSRAGTLHGM